MTARIIEQTMTDDRKYPWHPKPPRHRADDLVPFVSTPPADPWPNTRRD